MALNFFKIEKMKGESDDIELNQIEFLSDRRKSVDKDKHQEKKDKAKPKIKRTQSNDLDEKGYKNKPDYSETG